MKSTICRITRARRLGRAQRRRPARGRGRPTGPGAGRATSRSTGDGSTVVRAPPCRVAGAPTSSATACIVEADGEPRDRDRRGRRGSRSRSAGWPATTSPTRSRPPAGRAALGATIEQVRDGLLDFRPIGRALARAAQPVPARRPGRHRRLRPQRGRRRGDPRRGRGHRRRRRRAGGADHRDHRDRRRPAGRHAPRHRPDRRRAGPARRHQGDAPLPARPDRRSRSSASSWPASWPAAGARGRRARSTSRETDALRAELNGAAGRERPRRTARTPPGHRADVPRGARRRLRRCSSDLGARPVDVASELTELVPRLQGRPRRG